MSVIYFGVSGLFDYVFTCLFLVQTKHQKNYASRLRTNLQDTVISVPVWRRGLSSWGVNAGKEAGPI